MASTRSAGRTLVAALGAALLLALGPAPAAAQDGAAAEQELPETGPPGEQPVLRAISEAPSADSLRSYVKAMVGFHTRHTLSDTVSDTLGVGAARRWVHHKFEEISSRCGGCLDVRYQRFEIAPDGERIPDTTMVVNPVAIQRGTTHPNRYLVISGHLDSRVTDIMNDTSFAPGANDDASGVAGAIEAARVLSQYDFNASIVYMGVTGEEQGLYGSSRAAELFKERGWHVEAMLNNDMIGNIQGVDGVVDNTVVRVFSEGTRADETDRMATIRRYTGGENDSPSRNVARYVKGIADDYVRNLDVMMIYRLDRFGRGGDHRGFNAVGYPAVRFTEAHEDYEHQHADVRTEDGVEYGDTTDEVEFGYAAKVTGLDAASLAAMAWAPKPPSGVEIDGAVDPSTTLSWDAIDPARAPNLAGYRVYWRKTTSPTWEKSVFVGDTTEWTLENVVIDNYLFGVAAVSERGFESPVVFPGPVGAFTPASWMEEDDDGS